MTKQDLPKFYLEFETQWDCPPLDEAKIAPTEAVLGFKLPQAYIDLLRVRNGGGLSAVFYGEPEVQQEIEAVYRSKELGVLGLYGIGDDSLDSFYDGKILNEVLQDNWGYPKNSVVFSHAGHAGFALRYNNPAEEPDIIFVYAEISAKVIRIADNFADFLTRLQPFEKS